MVTRTFQLAMALTLSLTLPLTAGEPAPSAGSSNPEKPSPETLAAALAEAVRPTLESALRERAGVGFVAFSCVPPPSIAPGARFDCGAVDEDGDRLDYTIEVDEQGGATVVRTAQPVAQLPEPSRELLEPPCRELLEAYDRGDWERLHAGLHPRLRDSDPLEGMRERLELLRGLFGAVSAVTPARHAVRFEGGNELEYEVASARGRLLARFGLAPAEDGDRWVVTAFILTASPGSPEQSLLLQQAGVEVLSDAIGAPVARIDAPLEQLVRVGDAVEGFARLEDGRSFAVLVDQHGWRDDFDPKDFRFFVLDAGLVVRRVLDEELGGVATVECREAVVPDGGETRCIATSTSGDRLEVRLGRSGGEHQLRWRPMSGGDAGAGGTASGDPAFGLESCSMIRRGPRASYRSDTLTGLRGGGSPGHDVPSRIRRTT